MNTIEFHKTTTKELIALKNRVRLLVPHWGEDGRYKEVVLKSVIKRFLPEKYGIASGFVIRPTFDRGLHESSKQIDIIIYDKDYPVMFKEDDFVVATSDSVRAIIEVKANVQNQGLENVVRKANEIGEFIYSSRINLKERPFFNGIFSFDGYDRLNISDYDHIHSALLAAEDTTKGPNQKKFKVNHISFNKDKFFKFWNQNNSIYDGAYLYDVEDLSFSFLISNLIEHLQSESVFMNNQLWFPVDKSIISQKIS